MWFKNVLKGSKNPCNLDRGRKSNFCDISFDFKQKYEKKKQIYPVTF